MESGDTHARSPNSVTHRRARCEVCQHPPDGAPSEGGFPRSHFQHYHALRASAQAGLLYLSDKGYPPCTCGRNTAVGVGDAAHYCTTAVKPTAAVVTATAEQQQYTSTHAHTRTLLLCSKKALMVPLLT